MMNNVLMKEERRCRLSNSRLSGAPNGKWKVVVSTSGGTCRDRDPEAGRFAGLPDARAEGAVTPIGEAARSGPKHRPQAMVRDAALVENAGAAARCANLRGG